MKKIILSALIFYPVLVYSQNPSASELQKYTTEFESFFYQEKFSKAAQAYEWLLNNSPYRDKHFYEMGVMMYDYLYQTEKKETRKLRYRDLLDSLKTLTNINDSYNREKIITKYPEFPDGKNAFVSYVTQNVDVPQKMKTSGLTWADIKAKFTVGINGRITNVNLYSGFGEQWDNQVKEILKASPKWIPGEVNGQTAPVEMEQLIRFRMRF